MTVESAARFSDNSSGGLGGESGRAYIPPMRYVVFVVFAVLPLVLWPTIWTFFVVMALGIPTALALMPPEKPSELDPALWHSDPAIRAERYTAALADWKRQHSSWRWR